MKSLLLHVTVTDEEGHRARRTFVIREYLDGEVDIVEASYPRCDADRSVVIYTQTSDDVLLEVESA